MQGERFLRATIIFAAGFAAAVVVGARNGDQLADREAGMLEACDELARMDRADCFAHVDLMADALHELGERCVLLPGSERITAGRVPREVMP